MVAQSFDVPNDDRVNQGICYLPAQYDRTRIRSVQQPPAIVYTTCSYLNATRVTGHTATSYPTANITLRLPYSILMRPISEDTSKRANVPPPYLSQPSSMTMNNLNQHTYTLIRRQYARSKFFTTPVAHTNLRPVRFMARIYSSSAR